MNESDHEPNWLEACLAAATAARVTVFGDFCLDAYWVIDEEEAELSVETHLPIRRVRRQRYSLGGAGNIVANLAALGAAKIHAVGAVGDDLFGRRMLDELTGLGADCRGMLATQADWQTMVYAKPHVGDAEQNRIDFGGFNALAADTAGALAAQIARAAGDSDVVILNQQVPAGVSTAEMIERINAVVADRPGVRFIVDSRDRADLYRGVSLKLNAHEAARLCGRPRPLDERIGAADATAFARELFERTGETVFVSRGENGLVVAGETGIEEIPGIQIIEATDPVGAGDTVIAALAAALGGGRPPGEAARFANVAASVTVRKLRTTGTASPAEIRAVGATPDYVYLPELADDARGAAYLPGTEIEVVGELPEGLAVAHAIFDHDGTISTMRMGWEGIMEPMMVRAILGGRYADADEALYHKVLDSVRAYIDKTTGVQTLVQMLGLVEMVRHFGCVSAEKILDMHGYKALYNAELLAKVGRRASRLAAGELEAEDFQMKGARKMLEALRAAGVKLYLASGTDEADVVAEAEALGYAHCFEGRIFGAVGDIKVEAKRVVLERIFADHGLSGPELVTFGDGPVEIRETRKRGGVAVGVASDESRRFGLNLAKRARLIRAGADLVVGDFSQMDRLLGVLKIGTGGQAE